MIHGTNQRRIRLEQQGETMTKRNAILLALGCSFITGAFCTYFSCAIVFFGRLPGLCNF